MRLTRYCIYDDQGREGVPMAERDGEWMKAEDVRAVLREIQPLLILVANHIQASNSQSVQAQDLLTRLQEISHD